MVKVYLCSEDMSYSLLLPVTPPEIVITNGNDVRKYETANAGFISLVGFNQLAEVSFSSFFPSTSLPCSVGNAAFGIGYIPLNELMKKETERPTSRRP